MLLEGHCPARFRLKLQLNTPEAAEQALTGHTRNFCLNSAEQWPYRSRFGQPKYKSLQLMNLKENS